MRALSFNNPLDVSLTELPVPVPGDGEALVRIETSAICGSELHSEPGSGRDVDVTVAHLERK